MLGRIAILATLAALGFLMVPRLVGPKNCGGNSTAALATLRNLATVQEQYRYQLRSDADGDGRGEYGTFAELTDADPRRRVKGRYALLSASLSNLDDAGVATKSGYCFRIWLPRSGGGGVHEGRVARWTGGDPAMPDRPRVLVEGTPSSGPLDADAAEQRWCAFAWPVAWGSSGTRAFYVDQGGDVYECDNEFGRYGGTGGGPDWSALSVRGPEGRVGVPAVRTGRGNGDGLRWRPAR